MLPFFHNGYITYISISFPFCQITDVVFVVNQRWRHRWWGLFLDFWICLLILYSSNCTVYIYVVLRSERLVCLPWRVEDPAVGEEAHQLVGRGDGVQVRVFAVVEVSVRLPDPVQHRNTEWELSIRVGYLLVSQSRVLPRLAEITVERKRLFVKKYYRNNNVTLLYEICLRKFVDIFFRKRAFIYHVGLGNGTHWTNHDIHIDHSWRA